MQVLRDSEAADVIAAVAGLIRIFKKKLWELPSSHAIKAYEILLTCLENHYRYQSVMDGVSRVRLQVRLCFYQVLIQGRMIPQVVLKIW